MKQYASSNGSEKTKFLSHPVENNLTLAEHSIIVAEKSKELVSNIFNGELEETAFYAGFLHDIGKLNPFYQKLFKIADYEKRKKLEEELKKSYAQRHSILSAQAAESLLEKEQKINVSEKEQKKFTLIAIASHHSALKQLDQFETGEDREKLIKSQNEMYENLKEYFHEIENNDKIPKLNFALCLKNFIRPIYFDESFKNKNQEDYLKAAVIFSSLLQADRGSFRDWKTPNFDINIPTKKLIKEDSKLSELRTEFQNEIIKEYLKSNLQDKILVLEAPTGIGKTKIFLDLAMLIKKNNIERVLYFSPLLTLTEDFESKLRELIDKQNEKSILIYNHLFSGTLSEKNDENRLDKDSWVFETESFNQKLIITTTQRLLMTLYSNKASDKIKLLSLKNSLLIIDEVQTIPKSLLANLITMLKLISERMNSRVLLVSATIPDQLKDLPRIQNDEIKKIKKKYLEETNKKIVFSPKSEIIEKLTNESSEAKILVMVNTRKKAINLFKDLSENKEISEKFKDIDYISSGIKKGDRAKIIEQLKTLTSKIVVSTQVLEAGVDISFSKIYREMAPLDNIIQTMGRLNRELEKTEPELVVFTENPGDHLPYSELEFKESLKILKKVENSEQLYEQLPSYYQSISEKNERIKKFNEDIEKKFETLDFIGIWEEINKEAHLEENEETIFIPSAEEWDKVKGKLLKGEIQSLAYLTANLPPSQKLNLENFDEELLEKNILLPKKEYLDKIYDKKTGLDKWLALDK